VGQRLDGERTEIGVEWLIIDQLTLEGGLQEQLTLSNLGAKWIVRRVNSFLPDLRRGPLAQLAEQLTLNLVCFVGRSFNFTNPLFATGSTSAGEAWQSTSGSTSTPIWLDLCLGAVGTEEYRGRGEWLVAGQSRNRSARAAGLSNKLAQPCAPLQVGRVFRRDLPQARFCLARARQRGSRSHARPFCA
jgi:hypothetical protein